jgi:transcriptional regulator with XRE-family HTH domain
MNQKQQQKLNRLAHYRRRIGFSQRRVSDLLGHKSHASLSLYEQGRAVPNLITALRLEIILRVPAAFLFPDLYDRLKVEIRSAEERMAGYGQQSLFPEH